MADPIPEKNTPLPHDAATFGKIPHHAESLGNVPHDSASFGKVPHNAAAFGNMPQLAARKDNHTLTVREVSRMFEEAGVARCDRSITNWSQPNKQGATRLDAYFDPNERRYYITPESVRAVIAEEIARTTKGREMAQPPKEEVSEPSPLPHAEEKGKRERGKSDTSDVPHDSGNVAELRKELMDLKITNRAKDMYIEKIESSHGKLLDELNSVVMRLRMC